MACRRDRTNYCTDHKSRTATGHEEGHGTLILSVAASSVADDRSGSDLLAMADIATLEFHEAAASQFAINAQVEQSELSDSTLHLKADS